MELQPAKSEAYSKSLVTLRQFSDTHEEYSHFKIGRLAEVEREAQNGAGFGIMVSGVPVGDEAYRAAKLNARIEMICEGLESVAQALRPISAQALYAVVVLCFQPMMNYHMRIVPPHQVQPYLRRLNEALVKAIQQASGVDFNAEGLVYEFAKQRLWLPARLMDGALRSQTKVAETAYISGLIAALPSLIDVTMTVQGPTEVRQGFANVVGERLLGVGARNRGNEQNRFAFFGHESGTGLGDRFARLWRQLQREVAKEGQNVPTDGALSATVEAAGYVDGNEVKKMQCELTQQRDQAAFERLDAQIQARPQMIQYGCSG